MRACLLLLDLLISLYFLSEELIKLSDYSPSLLLKVNGLFPLINSGSHPLSFLVVERLSAHHSFIFCVECLPPSSCACIIFFLQSTEIEVNRTYFLFCLFTLLFCLLEVDLEPFIFFFSDGQLPVFDLSKTAYLLIFQFLPSQHLSVL